MKRLVLFLLATACAFAGQPPRAVADASPSPTLTLMTWNVENLFDAEDDPENEGDDEFTPGSWREWTEKRYRLKLTHLADVIAACEADLVALQEVENRRVLEDLAGVLREAFDRDYPFVVHREGPDHRGIDVAVLAMHPPVSSNWFTPLPGHRDVLEAGFAPHGSRLTLFVNHNKSRWGGEEETAPMRMAYMQAVGREMDRRFAEDHRQAIVVMGDFNDHHDDASLIEGLRSTVSPEDLLVPDPAWRTLNLHATLPPSERGTFFYIKGNVWNGFDSMHVSRGMLESVPGPGWKVIPGTYAVVRLPRLFDDWGRPKAFRRVSNPKTRRRFYQQGYSDHLPVRVRLRLETGSP